MYVFFNWFWFYLMRRIKKWLLWWQKVPLAHYIEVSQHETNQYNFTENAWKWYSYRWRNTTHFMELIYLIRYASYWHIIRRHFDAITILKKNTFKWNHSIHEGGEKENQEIIRYKLKLSVLILFYVSYLSLITILFSTFNPNTQFYLFFKFLFLSNV